MKWSVAAVLLMVSTPAMAQQPIHVNLLAYFDKVTPPPSSAKEAYEKCEWNGDHQASADKIFKALEEELQKMEVEISTPAGSVQADMAKKMQDPQFRKKMESMSEDEKMKIAMQMSQTMVVTPGPMKPEPEAVIKTLKDCSKLSESSSQDLTRLGTAAQQQATYEQDLEAKHKTVDDWEAQEIDKLPLIQVGEGTEHDEKAVDAVKINALKKHIAIADEDLKRTSSLWKNSKSDAKQRFSLFESDIEKIHFGDDAKNSITRLQLSSGQTLMINSLQVLLDNSRTAYLHAAEWYARLIDYQTQHRH